MTVQQCDQRAIGDAALLERSSSSGAGNNKARTLTLIKHFANQGLIGNADIEAAIEDIDSRGLEPETV